jgi:hypothetical protein
VSAPRVERIGEKLYTCNPLVPSGEQWAVWDMRGRWPASIVFVGSMEDALLVADALNSRMGAA